MQSQATKDFWKLYRQLPKAVRKSAKRAYILWRVNPLHAGLHFKRLQTKEALYSIRVGLHHRALGLADGDAIVWFWIGIHSDYDNLVK
jgi:hypothetical protein